MTASLTVQQEEAGQLAVNPAALDQALALALALQARIPGAEPPRADAPVLPDERIAQEIALLASRSDVHEELDRLASHIDAARAPLTEGVAVGRRLEFLLQEFNREANTLCSKSASMLLTAVGLRLKAAIEQCREQAANIE